MEELETVYAVMLPLVLVIALAEGIWLSRSRPEGYDWKAWACSLADLAGRRALLLIPYTLTAPYLTWAWKYRLFTQPLDNIGSFLLLFIGLEFFYYWYHRSSHTMRWFWASHSVHHTPNQLTLASAYRLGWFSRITGATVFFVPLVLLGFTPTVVLTALLLNLLYQFWLHADWIPRLGWLEGIFNTPSNHRVHHARNPEYLDANYGGVLVVFDRLFGTYIAERADVPFDYGTVTPAVSSHNPFVLNFAPWAALYKDLRSARSLHEVWMYTFGPPGWRSDGQGLTTAEIRRRAGLVSTPSSQPVMTYSPLSGPFAVDRLAAKEIAHGERQGLCRDRCGRCDGRRCARRFAREGYTAVVTRRSADKLKHLVAQITQEGGKVHPFGSDARDEEQVAKLFREIEVEIGDVEVFVFNIGGNVRFDIRDTTSRVDRKVWEMTAFAGFLTAREAAKAMVPRGRGTMLFTGATASLRGGRGFSAFAGGKHAVRALAQSMARELGPQNIHVAHVVIDGAIDTEWIKTNFPERYNAGPDAVLDPDDIAEVYWQIHQQKRSAWTFEMDLRPWKETW